MDMKTDTKKLSMVLSPEITKKLEEGDYNKNKLINRLLREYLQKKQK